MENLNRYSEDIKKLYGFESFDKISDVEKGKISEDLMKILVNELASSQAGGQDFTTYLSGLSTIILLIAANTCSAEYLLLVIALA